MYSHALVVITDTVFQHRLQEQFKHAVSAYTSTISLHTQALSEAHVITLADLMSR
jgi:hypothetical protein